MRTVGTALPLGGLFFVLAAATALAARWLGRPLPPSRLLLFAALSLLFVGPGLRGRAPIGPDQAFLTVPAPAAQPPRSVWLDDVARQIVPWEEAVRLAWKDGDLPLRNRWNGCGMPLDGNGQSAAWSPLTLAGLLLPPFASLSFWAALRLFLCLTGVWLWLTELSVSSRAALFGAVAFSFSLTMTAWIFFPLTASLCLWPWILFLLERLPEPSVRRRTFVMLAALLLLWPLSGHLESVVSAAAFTAIWLAARATTADRDRVRRMLPTLAAAALFALGLSAFSLVPQVLAILASNRIALVSRPFWHPILSLQPHFAGWPNGPLLVFFPRLFGDLAAIPMIPGAIGSFPEMALGYFGILPLSFALLVVRPGSIRPAAERALLVPLILGLGAAVGLWPFAEIVSAAPVLRHMFPLRYLSWVALAGAAVASFELDRLERDLARRRIAILWPLLSITGVLLIAGQTYLRVRGLYDAAGSLPAGRLEFLVAAAALAAGLAILAATAGKAEWFRAWGVPLLTAAAGVELFRQGATLYAWRDARSLYSATPLIEFLRSQPGPFRVAGQGRMLFPNANVFARLEDVRTHDPAERRDYVEFLGATCGYDPGAYFKEIADVNAPALDFLSVRYLVGLPGGEPPSAKWRTVYSAGDGTVFENGRALPPVMAPERLRVVRRIASGSLLAPANLAYGRPYRELFDGIDWSREAIVLDDGKAGFHPVPGSAGGAAQLSGYRETTNSVSFRARVQSPTGAILTTSLVQDGGWRASDEKGVHIPTGRANGPFLALAVTEGDHEIHLRYAPPGFRLGSAISLLTLAVLAAVALRSLRRG